MGNESVEVENPPATPEREGEREANAPGKMRGGMDAREMAQRSWATRRAAKQAADSNAEAAAESMGDETILVRVPISTGAIIKRLAADAAKGSTQAARELRGWMAEVQTERDVDVSELDRSTRTRLLARLLLEVEGAEEGSVWCWQEGKLVSIA